MLPSASRLVAYATGATIFATCIYYLFGPSIHVQDEDEETNSSRKRSLGTGLVNPGNDCFINSVLQALAGLDALQGHLSSRAKDTGPIEANGNGAGDCTTALSGILAALNERAWKRKSLSASHFIQVLEQSVGQRLNRRQQDAQEFLQILYERLAADHAARLKDASSRDKSSTPNLRKSLLPFEGQITVRIECQKCIYVPEREPDKFSMINLVVPNARSSTLDQCFDLLFMRENVEDYLCPQCHKRDEVVHYERILDKAKHESANVIDMTVVDRLREAIHSKPESTVQELGISPFTPAPRTVIHKATKITQYPPVLTIHLSRSVYSQVGASTKNRASVTFQEHLVLGPLIHRHRYRLYAMIVHLGTHNSGHYIAFRRQRPERSDNPMPTESAEISQDLDKMELDDSLDTGDAVPNIEPRKRATNRDRAPLHGTHRKKSNKKDHWYRISDTRVSECTTDDVLAAQEGVYLLFYQHEE